jgi:hypothetical protein
VGQKTHPKGFRISNNAFTCLNASDKQLFRINGRGLFYLFKSRGDFFNEFLSISKIKINRINQDVETKSM